MLELPEVMTIARQMNETLTGKRIVAAVRGNSPHKFVWYNLDAEPFVARLVGKEVAGAHGDGKFLFVDLDPGHTLLFGEMGGRLVVHDADAEPPKKHHLLVRFADGSFLTARVALWGGIEVLTQAEVSAHRWVGLGKRRPSPLSDAFTYELFGQLFEDPKVLPRTSAKAFLISTPGIWGVGNGYTQDILFRAGVHPKRLVADLSDAERRALYEATRTVLREATERGGMDTERDLHDQPGGYVRLLDSRAVGQPCTACGTPIVKIQYLGGAAYYCPSCQV